MANIGKITQIVGAVLDIKFSEPLLLVHNSSMSDRPLYVYSLALFLVVPS